MREWIVETSWFSFPSKETEAQTGEVTSVHHSQERLLAILRPFKETLDIHCVVNDSSSLMNANGISKLLPMDLR